MSTYRNPTEIINRDLGNIIINTVNKVTENHLKKQQNESDQRVKELAEARKEQQSINRAHQIYSEQIHADAVKSGAQSESFFKQVDFAINEKFRLMGLKAKETDPTKLAELTKGIQYYQDSVTIAMKTAEELNEWKKIEGPLLSGIKNEVGGIYTGINDGESESDFAKKVGRDYFLKLVLSGVGVKNGKPVGNPKFFIKTVNGIPMQYAYLESEGIENAFNVADVMSSSLAEIRDMDSNITITGPDGKKSVQKGFKGIYDDTGISSKDGFKINDAFILTDEETGLPILKKVSTTMEDGTEISGFIKQANIPRMINTVTPMFESFINAKVETVNNWDDYADINATMLEYMSKLTQEQLSSIGIDSKGAKQDLSTLGEGSYELTPEAKDKFEKVMLTYALSKYIKGFEVVNGEDQGNGQVEWVDAQGNKQLLNYEYDKEAYRDEEKAGITNIKTKEYQPPTSKFTTRQIRDINNTIKAFTDGKVQGNDLIKGMTIDGKKVSDFRFKGGKLTFLYEADPIIVTEENKEKYKDSEIGDEIIKEIPIKGYDGIKPTRNQLEPIVKKYVNKQYDLGQKERGILIDQIVEGLIKGQTDSTNITRGNKNNLPTGVTTFTNNPLVKK